MIIDQGIFGMARTGTIDDSLEYPAVFEAGPSGRIKRNPGYVEVAGRKIEIPDLLQPDHTGWYSDPDGQIAVIPDAITLIQRPQQLLSRIKSIRESAGFEPLIYAPGIGDPYLFPALSYAGISIFDDLFIRAESESGILYTALGKTEEKGDVLRDNISFAHGILHSVSESIRNLTLREVVEKYSISSRSVEILRLLDTSHYGYIEPLYPSRTPYIKANSVESLYRPDLTRYRDYVSKSYQRGEGKDIALLLPCTARKPYSASKTHRRIFSYIEKYAPYVHKVVVTSPVGIVPEELEETYPPAFYDIPTIGIWFEDEKKMINEMLTGYFSKNKYPHIIAYITPDLSFIEEALPKGSEIIQGNIRSDAMLKELRDKLSGLCGTENRTRVNYKVRKLKSIASYQFGSWIEPYIDDMKLVRSYNQDMFMKDGKAMLVYNDRAGKITITKEMGKTFIEEHKFVVQIDDFKPTANVYAMGVTDASSDIRQESEVVLECNGDLRGVGVAKMPFRHMIDLQKGTAVKVRN